MIRVFGILLFILFCSPNLGATHVIGGNFNIVQTGRNQFYIDLIIFRDCRTGVPNPPVALADSLWVRVFNQSDYNVFFDLQVKKKTPLTPQLGDDCFEPPNLCVEEYHLDDTLFLPDNAAGYIASMQICCRNFILDNILNPGATGMTVTAEIPDPALAGGNSTPQMASYPDNGFLCLFAPRSLDLSAADPDGDSLYYQLTRPYTSPQPTTSTPVPPQRPPYGFVNWIPGYSEADPIKGSPGILLDSKTGLLTITPIELGLFVFAYQIEEYRNGQLIGQTRRDIQLEVLGCVINEPPVFEQPTETTFETNAGEETCIAVRITDPNVDDTITVSSTFELSLVSESPPDVRLFNGTGTGTVGGRVCWTPRCEDAFSGNNLKFYIIAVSRGCDRRDTIREEITFNTISIPNDIIALLPNIFSPNGDGLNDEYKLQSELPYPCLGELEMRIFNRWGVEVYHNELSDRFGWDGKFKGRDATPGTYFYVITGKYGASSFEKKSFLTLVR
jgi:gliding motility-associated-like protein